MHSFMPVKITFLAKGFQAYFTLILFSHQYALLYVCLGYFLNLRISCILHIEIVVIGSSLYVVYFIELAS